MLFKTDTASLELACLEYPAALYTWAEGKYESLLAATDLVLSDLAEEDFTAPDRRGLFTVFKRAWAESAGEATGMKLRFDGTNGAGILFAQMGDAFPVPERAQEHVDRLKDGRRRDVAGRKLAAMIAKGVQSGAGLSRDLAEEMHTTLTEALEGAGEDAATTPGAILKRKESRRMVRIMTGLRGFDDLTGGFTEGSLVVPYGLSGCGKSALMVSMMDQLHGNGVACAYFSLEMPGEDVVARMMARRSEIPASIIRDLYAVHPDSPIPPNRSPLTEDQRHKLDMTRDWLEDTPLFIYGDGDLGTGFHLGMIGRAARRGAKVVFLDYAQLALSQKGEITPALATAFSAGLKREAARHGVVVVAVCQISREAARKASSKRDGEELSMGEMPPPAPLWGLKESGAWEQDAVMCVATVIPPMLTEAGRPVPMTEPVAAEIHVMKHRNGPKGCVEMTWNGPLISWFDGAPEGQGWD